MSGQPIAVGGRGEQRSTFRLELTPEFEPPLGNRLHDCGVATPCA
jgi:hypothetical protein